MMKKLIPTFKSNNMIVLQFDSIEKTKNAYEELKSNNP